MYETIALQNSKNPYGAFELKQLYPRNYSLGLTIAAVVHLLIIAVYFLVVFFQAEELDLIPSAKIKTIVLGTPPPLREQIPQLAITGGSHAKPNDGIVVPVPDALVSPEQTLATQDEINSFNPGTIVGDEKFGYVIPDNGKQIETNDSPDPEVFIPVQKFPEVVVRAVPVYPELAIRSGLSGRVLAKILVSREGVPQKVLIIKSDAEIFNQSTIDAAMNYRFTPAIQNNKPIAVWIVVPFKFELRGN